jgi:transketolase C-terminal domain/subunit
MRWPARHFLSRPERPHCQTHRHRYPRGRRSETGGIVSIEEHAVDGGLGGAIAEALMEAGASRDSSLRMGLRNTFSSVVGSQQYLRKVYSLDAAAIARTVSTKLGIAAPALA